METTKLQILNVILIAKYSRLRGLSKFDFLIQKQVIKKSSSHRLSYDDLQLQLNFLLPFYLSKLPNIEIVSKYSKIEFDNLSDINALHKI